MSYWDRLALRKKRDEEQAKRRESPTPIDAFCYRVLREGYAKVICRMSGQKREHLSDAQVSAMLEPFEADMDRDAFLLGEAISKMREQGASELYAKLSTMPGVDREMLAESISYVYESGEPKDNG